MLLLHGGEGPLSTPFPKPAPHGMDDGPAPDMTMRRQRIPPSDSLISLLSVSCLMHPVVVAQIVGLITLANSVPVVAKNILGDRFAWPLDFGAVLGDGHRLFGESKTIRGVLLGIFACLLAAPMIGVDPAIGAMAGALAMAGDLFSSFIKRRMNRPPSSQALGLDQIPESLFPLLACISPLGLTLTDVLAGTVIFMVGELLLSRLLFRLHLRDRPY